MHGEGERLEHAMVVYENVRMVLERLRDMDAELDAREFPQFDVIVRAKEHLALARQELNVLAAVSSAR